MLVMPRSRGLVQHQQLCTTTCKWCRFDMKIERVLLHALYHLHASVLRECKEERGRAHCGMLHHHIVRVRVLTTPRPHNVMSATNTFRTPTREILHHGEVFLAWIHKCRAHTQYSPHKRAVSEKANIEDLKTIK